MHHILLSAKERTHQPLIYRFATLYYESAIHFTGGYMLTNSRGKEIIGTPGVENPNL